MIQQAVNNSFTNGCRMNGEAKTFLRDVMHQIADNVEQITDPRALEEYLNGLFGAPTGFQLYRAYCQGGPKPFVTLLAQAIIVFVPEQPKRTVTLRHLLIGLSYYPVEARIRSLVPNFPLETLEPASVGIERKDLLRKDKLVQTSHKVSEDVQYGLRNLCILVAQKYQHQSDGKLQERCAMLGKPIVASSSASRSTSSTSSSTSRSGSPLGLVTSRSTLHQLQQACIDHLLQTMESYRQPGSVVLTYNAFIKGLQQLQWPELL